MKFFLLLILSGLMVSFSGTVLISFFLFLDYLKHSEFNYISLYKSAIVFFIAGFIIPIPELIRRHSSVLSNIADSYVSKRVNKISSGLDKIENKKGNKQ